MTAAEAALNIVNGNRSDAAQAIIHAPNPAFAAVDVIVLLIDDHGYTPDRAISTMQSLTSRPEFWEQPR